MHPRIWGQPTLVNPPQCFSSFPHQCKKLREFGTIHETMSEIPTMQHHFTFKHVLRSLSIVLFLGLLWGCSSPEGTQVKMPFSGKKYMSDARHFRGVGMGQSNNLNIAKSKAELESRKVMAQQVRTTLQVVSDAYSSEINSGQAAETTERFQSLAREVTNTTIGDIRQMGQDIRQLEDQSYRVHVAAEIKKKAMFRFLKNKAKSDSKISELMRADMVRMLDREIERLEAEE
jgi:hypothetical protein